MWDGIAVWPFLGFTAKSLIKNGINMNASTYPDAFAVYYDELTLEGMARGYAGERVALPDDVPPFGLSWRWREAQHSQGT